ncbi:hypothetical protein [Chryseobacterium sp. PMSZPI]|uniref:hypothetical protein n=1 Tax=Chryseobacterium sp. PMSZPI TaxID=1033900 RepID=UPI000C3460F4|nr:hypothetical protein [Chryseobacterium sp. PMSZPI]PKF76190.1 hypothetical protein CW752_00975 [Chryseobacterium sp. PMSZPI]
MKLTMSLMFIGVFVLSCKKEVRTERSVTTDSIIMDTVRTDTTTHAAPMPSPARSDTMHRKDSISSKKQKDTIKISKNKKNKK